MASKMTPNEAQFAVENFPPTLPFREIKVTGNFKKLIITVL